jgi:hypothetical protein
MSEYRQAQSVALYNASITISITTASGATVEEMADNQEYPLAAGTPPGSFCIPEKDISGLKSELKTGKHLSLPTGRRAGGALHLNKTLSSYNATLDEGVRVKNLLIRIDGPQLLSIQIVEELHHAEEKHTQTKEITYCGFFAVDWATPEL